VVVVALLGSVARQADRLAPAARQLSVFIDRHAQAVVDWIFDIVAAYEVDKLSRVDVGLICGHNTLGDNVELRVDRVFAVFALIGILYVGHAQDNNPERGDERNEQLPLITNTSL